ncbi:MAG: two-component sensor histidine kinase, partial [Chloroflexota bacterium]
MRALVVDGKEVKTETFEETLLEVQRLAGIGTLTAGVAHELTNPINVITATCNNLLSQMADDSLSTDE